MRPGPPVRVLLVDDQVIIGESVKRIVERHDDITLSVCDNPRHAIDAAETFEPTVILLDLVMPVVDGLTLLRFFRAHPQLREVPIVVLSTKEDPVVKADAFALGANDYIVKLPDEVELLARVRHHSAGYAFLRERDDAQRTLAENIGVLERLNDELEERNGVIQRIFGRYVSPDVVDELLDQPGGVSVQGQRRLVTILMTDIRDFTRITEQMRPEKVVELLNIVLGRMAKEIETSGGIVDAFIGDAILALYGAPIGGEDDAQRAIMCALRMQCLVPELNEVLRERDLPAITMGIGLNTGHVVVGNIGSEQRMSYTAVGSHVNLAARIVSQASSGQVLISESTLNDADPESLVVADTASIDAKGFSHRVVVHDVVAVTSPASIALPS